MANGTNKEQNRIVAHYKNGRLLKGHTDDFVPAKETFRLMSEYGKNKRNTYEVRTSDLKALFFVKTLDGQRNYTEKNTFDEADTSDLRGVKVKAEFCDGEVIRGMSFDYSKDFRGFYIIPVDPQGNNDKVYIVTDSTRNIVVVNKAAKN
jgi:hypothetical protein